VRRILRAAAGAVLIAIALALVMPGRAAAHAQLVFSTPPANASLLTSPKFLSMTFSEAIDPVTASVRLLDDLQQPVAGIEAVRLDGSGSIASAGLPPLDPGLYTVSYRVTSAVDGHVSTGTWAFLVDPTGTLPPPTLASQSTSPSDDVLSVSARWVALAAGLGLLGLALFWIVSARPALRELQAAAGGTDAPWGAIAIIAAIAFAGLAAYLTLAARPFVEGFGGHVGHGGGGAFPLDFAAPFGATPFANAMRLAEVAVGVAFVLATGRYFSLDEARRRGVRAPRDRDPATLWLVASAAAIGLAGSSLAGHAAARGGVLFAAVDWVHLLAVAAWVGTLPGILLVAWRARRVGPAGEGLLSAILRRHSRLALAAAPIVALTGLANSPLVLGDARGLVSSAYGNVLLAKATLFSVAVAIGSANFFLIRSGLFRRTVPLIAVELAVGALAVLGASSLVTSQPAAGRVPVEARSGIGALHLYGRAGESTVHAAVIVPAPGEQQYQVSVADAATSGYRTDVQGVVLVFAAPAGSDLPQQRVELKEGVQPWLWGTSGAYTPIVGDWSLEVLVHRAGVREETATFDLPVAEPLAPAVVPPPDTGIGVPAPLALLWLALPAGRAAWLVPIGLLLGLAAVLALERGRGQASASSLPVLRVVLVVLALTTGLAAGSRAAVEIANQAPTSAAAAANPIPAAPDSVARGQNLYRANCASCHGIGGVGDGATAQDMVPGPGDLSASVPALMDGELAYLISAGTVATRMPAFSTTLSEQDRWDLVNYLRATWPGITR
jgi:putative copper export protein/methionine-rich copper-binding protein CopC/mono/diheme cytochrome c family protein